MRKRSPKGNKIEKCLMYYREIFKMRYDDRCMICGRYSTQLPLPLSSFHIYSRTQKPRLILYEGNLLLACWVTDATNDNFCHNAYHHCRHDDPKYIKVINGIKHWRGQHYERDLKIAEKTLPRLGAFQVELKLEAMKQEYERLKHGEKI